ncbi:unnamed protein product [Lathyrus oleraceus]
MFRFIFSAPSLHLVFATEKRSKINDSTMFNILSVDSILVRENSKRTESDRREKNSPKRSFGVNQVLLINYDVGSVCRLLRRDCRECYFMSNEFYRMPYEIVLVCAEVLLGLCEAM